MIAKEEPRLTHRRRTELRRPRRAGKGTTPMLIGAGIAVVLFASKALEVEPILAAAGKAPVPIHAVTVAQNTQVVEGLAKLAVETGGKWLASPFGALSDEAPYPRNLSRLK